MSRIVSEIFNPHAPVVEKVDLHCILDKINLYDIPDTYPLDNAIQCLNNRGHTYTVKPLFKIRTPKGQNQVSALQRCPYYRGRECMIIRISGTKRTVRNREVSVRRG